MEQGAVVLGWGGRLEAGDLTQDGVKIAAGSEGGEAGVAEGNAREIFGLGDAVRGEQQAVAGTEGLAGGGVGGRGDKADDQVALGKTADWPA